MEDNGQFEFALPTNPLPERLQNSRSRNEFTDVKITAGKKTFRAHRIVLFDASPVLRAWLSGNWQVTTDNKREATLQFNEEVIDSSIVEDLLDYFYVGKITLTEDNAAKLFKASDFLDLPELWSASVSFLSTGITASNIFDRLLLADKREVIHQGCVKFLLENYEVVLQDPKLKSFSAENFMLIISALTKNREAKRRRRQKEALFESLMAWDEHDSNARSTSLPALLEALPLNELSDRFILEFVTSGSSSIPVVLSEIKKLRSRPSNSCDLFCCGGVNEAGFLPSLSHLNISTMKWTDLPPMPAAKAFHCGAVINENLYLFGGYDGEHIVDTVYAFNFKTDTWKQCRSMPEKLIDCAAAVLNGQIYVSGGSTTRVLNNGLSSSVMRYCAECNEWQQVKPMKIARAGHQLIQHNGRLYAMAGVSQYSVEEYNPATDEWTMKANTKYSHWRAGATLHNEKIYVCSAKGFEVYCPHSDAWNILEPLNNFKGRTLVSANGKLVAMGGKDGQATKSMSEFDTGTGKWNQLPDMDIARSYHSSFVVQQ